MCVCARVLHVKINRMYRHILNSSRFMCCLLNESQRSPSEYNTLVVETVQSLFNSLCQKIRSKCKLIYLFLYRHFWYSIWYREKVVKSIFNIAMCNIIILSLGPAYRGRRGLRFGFDLASQFFFSRFLSRYIFIWHGWCAAASGGCRRSNHHVTYLD